MLKRTSTVLGLFLLAQLAACSGSGGFVDSSANSASADTTDTATAATTPVAQMNDLSVLYPLATSTKQMSGYLKPTAKTASGHLLPVALFNAVTGSKAKAVDGSDGVSDDSSDDDAGTSDAGTTDGGTTDGVTDPGNDGLAPGSSPVMVYSHMRAVAFRFDPCFANIGPIVESTCQNQLRVIFQSLTLKDGSATAVDGAVHVFFTLTRAQLVAAVNEVIAARLASDPTGSDLGPLAVHPIVSQQGMGGAMSDALNKIVLKYASGANIIKLTQFIGGNLDTAWHFSGINVAGSATTPIDIVTLPSGTTEEIFAMNFGAEMAMGAFTPPTTAQDDMQLLTHSNDAKTASAAVQQAAYDAALRVQNPNFNSPNTIDCASCHTAQAAQVVTGEAVLGFSSAGNPNAFIPDVSFVSANDSVQTTPITPTSAFNAHAFSYLGATPMINQRVISETEGLVAYMNGQILPNAQ